MPTRTTRKWQPGDKTPRERARMLGSRIGLAIQHAGLTVPKVARLVDRMPSSLTKACKGEFEPLTRELVKIAFTCEVDPRWLATGEPSPAAAAALEVISDEHLLGPISATALNTSKMLFQFLRERLQRTPQPISQLGQCRYCCCTYHEACEGGCSWVDGDETICSACLDPERDRG